MNKKLLIAAVGAALIVGPMVASAAVMLNLDLSLSVDRQDNDDGTTRTLVSSNSSKIVLSGSEDLDGGLKAIGLLDTSFSADEASGGTLANRNTYGGLTGGFGTFRIGRIDTPYKELGYKINRFITYAGDTRVIMGNALDNNSRLGFDARPDNVLRYDTPTFGGAKVSYLYSNRNGIAPTADTDATGQSWNSLSASWQAGPLFLGAAFEKHGKTPTTTIEEDGIRAVAEYSFGAFTLGALWDSLSDLGGVAGTDVDVMGIAGAFKLGKNLLKFHYLDRGKADNSATDNGAKLMALGVDHALSKTATLYAVYATVDNDAGSAITPHTAYTGHGENLGTVAGKSPNTLSVGMVLKF